MFYTQLVDTTLGAFENREYETHLLQARLRLVSPRATPSISSRGAFACGCPAMA